MGVVQQDCATPAKQAFRQDGGQDGGALGQSRRKPKDQQPQAGAQGQYLLLLARGAGRETQPTGVGEQHGGGVGGVGMRVEYCAEKGACGGPQGVRQGGNSGGTEGGEA